MPFWKKADDVWPCRSSPFLGGDDGRHPYGLACEDHDPGGVGESSAVLEPPP